MKLYMRWPGAKVGRFLVMFIIANLVGLALLLGFVLIV